MYVGLFCNGRRQLQYIYLSRRMDRRAEQRGKTLHHPLSELFTDLPMTHQFQGLSLAIVTLLTLGLAPYTDMCRDHWSASGGSGAFMSVLSAADGAWTWCCSSEGSPLRNDRLS